MKKEVLKAGLIGCGDYLRREIDSIYNSKYFEVKYTYDPDQQKRRKMADRLVAASVDSTEVIFGDEEISIVMIYTPPSSRRELFTMAVDRRKHIITSAPFGTSLDEGRELKQIINDRVNCAVFYDRTGDASAEKIREILKSGEIGKLALYKEDLLCHYPTWNDWAKDSEKVEGQFMVLMSHNLKKSRYLMDPPDRNVNIHLTY